MNVEKINEAIGVVREHCSGMASCSVCGFYEAQAGCRFLSLPKNWCDISTDVPHEYFSDLCRRARRESLLYFTFDYNGVQYYTKFEYDGYVRPTVIRKIK